VPDLELETRSRITCGWSGQRLCAVRDFRGPRYRFRPQGFQVVLFLQHLPAKRVATNEFLGRAGAGATGLSV